MEAIILYSVILLLGIRVFLLDWIVTPRHEKAIRRLARNQKYFKTDLSDDFEKGIDNILNGKH
jgi:hypothetical protein